MPWRSGGALDSKHHDPGLIPVSAGPAAAIFFHLRWSFCCAAAKTSGGERGGPKRKNEAQTCEKELGPWFFFSNFLLQPKKMLRWARTIFFRIKITTIFLCYRNLKNKKAGFKPVQNIMLIPKKILCCNLDAYVNSVSYSDSWAHVNYIAFLSPLWFEHDIKSVTISIFILWRFQRFVTKTGPKLKPIWVICKSVTKIHKSSQIMSVYDDFYKCHRKFVMD